MEVDWLISIGDFRAEYSRTGKGERERRREGRKGIGQIARCLSFELNSDAEGCWIIWIGQCVEINRAKCQKWIWKGDQEIKRGREGGGRIETIWKRWSRNGQGWEMRMEKEKERGSEEERVVSVCVCHSGIPHANQAEDFQMAEEQVEEIGSLKQKKKKRRL